MKNKRLLILGVFALLLAVGLNVRHALNDYGIKKTPLHLEAMACTTGSCHPECGVTLICSWNSGYGNCYRFVWSMYKTEMWCEWSNYAYDFCYW